MITTQDVPTLKAIAAENNLRLYRDTEKRHAFAKPDAPRKRYVRLKTNGNAFPASVKEQLLQIDSSVRLYRESSLPRGFVAAFTLPA